MRSPLARERRSPPGFIRPCQPTLSAVVPTGPQWIHEIKHDGIRVIARRDGPKVQIWSRYGRTRTQDFPAIVDGLLALPADRFVLDGEALAHCPKGLPDFHQTLSVEGQRTACLIAYDLLEVASEDQRLLPLERRRDLLQNLLADAPQVRISEHMEGPDGPAMFTHACRMGLEGIVSKRRDRAYKSGRCATWLKIKNPGYERRP